MSYYAKCPMDIWVMLPDGIEKAKGDQIPCPHECGRCSSQCFNTVFVKNRIPATYCKYNDHEIVSVWSLDIPSQASIAPLRSREAVETNTASNSRNVETSPEDDLSVKGVQSAYVLRRRSSRKGHRFISRHMDPPASVRNRLCKPEQNLKTLVPVR